MKTILTELIEDLQDTCPDYYNNNYNWLHNLLEKEKQQIIDAVEWGLAYRASGQMYYSEKFK